MASEFSTHGQELALRQLEDIANASDNAIEIVEIRHPADTGAETTIRISVVTRDFTRTESGFNFRVREPLKIVVSPRFPLEYPRASFAHSRFLGFPHVQWGHHICLYQSPDVEWSASDGMFGFVGRLNDWLRDAALDQLDPDDAPLHPPAIYVTSPFKAVVKSETPTVSEKLWLGSVHLKIRNPFCYDIEQWFELSETFPEDKKLGACILLSEPLPLEYPDTVLNLIKALENRNVPFSLLFSWLKILACYQQDNEDLFFVIGAPMRRLAGGEEIQQHLAMWRINADSVADLKKIILSVEDEKVDAARHRFLSWAVEAATEWCSVYDSRPKSTYRRDHDTPASWMYNKRVIVLGCGALGSHIAEYAVRAGVEKIMLIDNKVVKPGVLVRQQFDWRSVGYSKQSALAVRLNRIDPDVDVLHELIDLRKGFGEFVDPGDYDLIIDATASRIVSASLQLEIVEYAEFPPLLTCSIDSEACRGIATLSISTSETGPSDLSRNTKLLAHSIPHLAPYASAFWPNNQHDVSFQPEPGCSEPTFVGSAADVAYFSSAFFNFAVTHLSNSITNTAFGYFVTKTDAGQYVSPAVVQICNPNVFKDDLNNYTIHCSSAAERSLHAEIAHNARAGNRLDETGGLMFGEIDDSLRRIYVDAISPPPPDSDKSPALFVCGIEGTQQLKDYYKDRSGGSTGFIGVWHTHPVSVPEPSAVDLAAVAQLLHAQVSSPRQIAMLIIGHAASLPDFRFHLFQKNQFTIYEHTR